MILAEHYMRLETATRMRGKDPNVDKRAKARALKFMIHFVGGLRRLGLERRKL